jgi:gas vesicle protein
MDPDQSNEAPPQGDALASAKNMLSDAGQTLTQEASKLASTAKDKATDGLSQKKESATQTIAAFADAIRKAGDDLAEHDQSALGRVVKQAADGLATMSRSVSEKSPEDLLHTVRELGRSNPVAFIAGSVLVGVALGRFARSSAQHSAQDPGDDQRRLPAPPLGPMTGSFGSGASVGDTSVQAPAAYSAPISDEASISLASAPTDKEI